MKDFSDCLLKRRGHWWWTRIRSLHIFNYCIILLSLVSVYYMMNCWCSHFYGNKIFIVWSVFNMPSILFGSNWD